MGSYAALLAFLAATGLAGVRYGEPPPDVPLPVLAARVDRVASERGRVVVVHFWATWCHVCVEELPRFARLQKKYGRDLDLITVSNEPDDVAASYLRLWELRLPLVADTTGRVFKAYGVGPLPATVVIDRAGLVRYVSVGEPTEEELAGGLAAAGL